MWEELERWTCADGGVDFLLWRMFDGDDYHHSESYV